MKASVSLFAVLLIAGLSLAATDDLENSFKALTEAESKSDPALVKKLAAETCALARKVIATPAPAADAEKEAWASRVARARSIEVHTEYSLYAAAVKAPPATTIELLSALEEQNPKSKYLNEAYAHYFLALTKSGAAAKIPAVAEKALANLPDNEDLLLVMADTAMNRKQVARAHGYAERLIGVLSKRGKPEGLSAVDWERKRTAALGRGYWIAGLMHMEKKEYYEADKDLRLALPLVKGNSAMTGAALFHLGVANYQLGMTFLRKSQVLEAIKFSDQVAAMDSPFALQARRNAYAMRNDAAKMR